VGTGYRIVENGLITLEALEGSGKFDLDFCVEGYGSLTLLGGITPEELAEIGLRMLQAVLYNCADVDETRTWLHARVNEVDQSGVRTVYPDKRCTVLISGDHFAVRCIKEIGHEGEHYNRYKQEVK
jgi:hypothetical protein